MVQALQYMDTHMLTSYCFWQRQHKLIAIHGMLKELLFFIIKLKQWTVFHFLSTF